MPTARGEWTEAEITDYFVAVLNSPANRGRRHIGYALSSCDKGEQAKVLVGPGEVATLPVTRRVYTGDFMFADDVAA